MGCACVCHPWRVCVFVYLQGVIKSLGFVYVCMYVCVCMCVCVCVHTRRVIKSLGLVCVCVCLCVCVYPQGVINSNFSNGLQT